MKSDRVKVFAVPLCREEKNKMANGVSTTQIREFLATLPVNKVFHLSEIMELIEKEPG